MKTLYVHSKDAANLKIKSVANDKKKVRFTWQVKLGKLMFYGDFSKQKYVVTKTNTRII
jgi:hypothetical protein